MTSGDLILLYIDDLEYLVRNDNYLHLFITTPPNFNESSDIIC